MQSREATLSQDAIQDEYDSIMANMWVLVDLPDGSKPIGCKWVFNKKMLVNGSVDKFKARLVVKGFAQKEDIDYFDTYSPVARISIIRLLIAMAAIDIPIWRHSSADSS